MSKDMSYSGVMSRRNEIMKNAIGIDYTTFESGSLSFDYEKMMRETGYTLEEMQKNPILYRSRKNSSFRA
jgi:hypothetical protein